MNGAYIIHVVDVDNRNHYFGKGGVHLIEPWSPQVGILAKYYGFASEREACQDNTSWLLHNTATGQFEAVKCQIRWVDFD